jgi:enterochelin esterase-like enzyme
VFFFKNEGIFRVRGRKQVLIQTTAIAFLSAIMAGCISPAEEPTLTVFTPAITPQATCLIPTVSAQAPILARQTDVQCTESGQVERYLIDSVLMNGELYFSVYFPPCYSEAKSGGYPVLYTLHGQNFNDEMWMDLGAAETADALILSGAAEPFMIVMPYEEFFFREVEGNNFPRVLIEEIIPWVEESFNVCAEKACRAIGGISRGASWAIRIGLTERDFFGSIGAHSLPTFNGDISSLPEWLDEVPYGEEPRIYLDTGRFDPEVKSAYRFENTLNEKGIPHEWHLNEGRHNEAYWEEQMEAYLRWYTAGWEQVK